jgi:hypothetical protein
MSVRTPIAAVRTEAPKMSVSSALAPFSCLEDVVMGVHGRLETVDAGGEALLGRGDRGHDVGGLGALGGVNGGIDLEDYGAGAALPSA